MPFLEEKQGGDGFMKVIFRVYEYRETIEQEFTNIDQVQEIIDRMGQNCPNLVFEPYIEVDDSCIVEMTQSC